ncbi:MAG: flagellin [Gammaproteobacteria bacterium]|nr:flagellin [Gammaproteobacteria bacterium]MDP2346889.1 flagellin [Gammaproteobacteria bacterium]
MAQVINTNVASLNAQRNLNSSQAGTNKALERLSSGLRINSAKDDAAGLAISTRFQSQINGLNVAIRNAGDGVSLAQTAEGALGSMTDSLQRIRELALQSSNGTNSAEDRQALNSEAQQLISEVTRAGAETNFNGLNLLDGSFKSVFQVGANAGETISVSIGKLTADTLGVSSKSGVSATATSTALSVGDLVINGAAIGASRASDDTASTALQSSSAIAKAAAINRSSAESGVTAIVDKNVAAGSSMTAAITAGNVVVNGTTISVQTTADAASSRASVVSAINAQSSLTGVTAVDSGDDSLGVSLVAADGRNITTSFTGSLTAASTGLKAAGTDTGGYTLVANSGVKEVSVAGANLANSGLVAGTYTAGVATVSSTARVAGAGTVATSGAVTGTAAANVAFDYSAGTPAELATLTGGVQLSATGTNFSAATAGAHTAGNVDLTGFANNFIANGSAAVLEGTVDFETAFGAGSDFAANSMNFRISVVDGDNYDVSLTGDYQDASNGGGAGDGLTALVADINGQLAGSGFTASINGDGQLTFTQDTASDATVIFTGQFGDQDSAAVFGFTALNDTAVGTAETAIGTFDVTVDGGAAQTVTLSTNIGNQGDLLTAINGQLVGATASVDDDGFLTITSATTGTASSVQVGNIGGSLAGGAILGLSNGSTSGTAANDIAFTFTSTDGGADVVTLDQDYTDAAHGGTAGAGNVALLADINTAISGSGFTATLNQSNQLVFTEDANGAATATFTDAGGSVSSVLALGIGEGATDTGVVGAGATNATFDVYVDGGLVQSVNVNANVADADDLLAEINGQLTGATASINDDGELVITSDSTGSSSSVQIANLAGNTSAELKLAASSGTGAAAGAAGYSDLSSGDVSINGVSIRAGSAADDTASYSGAASSSKAASGIAVAAAINASKGSTGVTATVNATTTVGTSAATAGTAGNSGSLYLNGIEISMTVQDSADANRTFAVNQINAVSGQTGVVAQDNGTSLTLSAADGRNIVMALDTNGGSITAGNFGLAGAGVSSSDFTDGGATGLARANADATTTYSTVSLKAAGSISVSGGTNGNAALESLGLQQGSFGGAVSGQFLNEVDISTQEGANSALAAIDNALNSVNSARADLGAIQNRFETTVSNLALTSENLSAANSRILDADFAAEAAALSRSQVLQQAGISILSQANAAPQQVLSLLQ